MEVAVKATNLYKTFKMGNLDVEVLKDINLSIHNGEFVSIMGPSGSGKSTLLYLIGALDKPTSGNIKIKGKELSVMKDKDESLMRRQDIGFVFQFYNLIPNLNVEENIMLPILLDRKKTKNYKHRLDELLEVVGLSDRRNHTPRELSGGQQQRVAIARALINEPDIILADEPIGNLDSKSGTEIMKLLKKINIEKGKTIIQVTHSQEASEYGEKIINLKDGRVDE
ncbi:ABC transporter ATP-binding protein [Herbivorax sp. ANBcel31]|uniref:ABC transporter ATP-binding protein n=1 Tax=Herbivorax sp. ANBcel31 TaxID=3069754 RepID=UPI0027B60D24|nr:ABC transporter ATP-binding protein [Herbivorax sp. ANBcel31]MDQ2086232.1 ABC transporter ATP-binding protein [Herbivorax sp. ANBcel31]